MERLSFTVFADGRFWAIKALLTYGDIKLLEGFLEIIDAEFGDMFQGAGLKRVGATESGEFIECSYRNSTTGLVFALDWKGELTTYIYRLFNDLIPIHEIAVVPKITQKDLPYCVSLDAVIYHFEGTSPLSVSPTVSSDLSEIAFVLHKLAIGLRMHGRCLLDGDFTIMRDVVGGINARNASMRTNGRGSGSDSIA